MSKIKLDIPEKAQQILDAMYQTREDWKPVLMESALWTLLCLSYACAIHKAAVNASPVVLVWDR